MIFLKKKKKQEKNLSPFYMRVTQSDGEWEKGSGGWRDKGQPLVSKGEGWTLGGSSDQKFFMASPYSPLTAVFLMTWEIRSVVGAEVA